MIAYYIFSWVVAFTVVVVIGLVALYDYKEFGLDSHSKNFYKQVLTICSMVFILGLIGVLVMAVIYACKGIWLLYADE